ncbi:MAG: zinc-ribbon domain-containing protein [Polyangiaceae bacterium]
MDVQCERCKAEYEFDDALISGRGTTVKCTNCGHQFKIRRTADAPDAAPDRWAVRTTEGRELVFTSLRELQKAIKAREVGRADTLTRGNGPPRALGAIAELEPFFEEAVDRAWGSEPPKAAPKTLMASSAVAQVPPKKSSRPPPAPPPPPQRTTLRPVLTPTPAPTTALPQTTPPVPAMRPRIDTIRPPETASAAVPPPLVKRPPGAAVSVAPVLTAGDLVPDSEEPATGRLDHTPPMPVHMTDPPIPLRPPAPKTLIHAPVSAPPGPPPRKAMTSAPPGGERPPPPTITVEPPALPPPTVPVRVQDPYRRALSSVDDTEEEVEVPTGHPRRLGGWLVALVLIAGAGVIGFAVAKPYLDARTAQKADVATALDPRAASMLTEGERALAAGDLEGANDAFTKASALAEKDARVLVDVARLANARADVPWLRSRVLPSDATDDLRTTNAQLAELGGRAKKAAMDASAAAPDQPSAILAKIDALRIAGDNATARTLVAKVIQSASQPETAYSLAALDLAEAEPLWPMVIERLRLAAAGEGDAGRGRAALVYALARSGDSSGAKAELDKLAGLSRPYPLVGALRAFVAKVPAAKDAGAPAGTVDVSSLAHANPRASWGGGAGGGGTGGGAGGGGGGGGGGGESSIHYAGANDPRFLLAQAESAKSSHDYDRARALYSSALAQNASDSEALAGLGDVDHAQHDLPAAAGYYKRALSVNPVYLPALVGMGDVEWESGDKDEAQKTYRDIMDRFPEGTYPGHVRQRATASSGASAPTPAATTAPTATSDQPGASK